MSETIKASGCCACGAITITADAMSTSAGACHCDTCRKWNSGPLMTVECSHGVSFTGQDNISIFNSSDWAERGFCKLCGSHLFYRLKQDLQYHLPIGLFNIEAALTFDHQVFIDRKPAYYSFSNKTKDMTGEELFAFVAKG